MNLRNEIKYILTPPSPPDAHLKGGVVDWEYKLTKDGIEFVLDRIMETIKKAQSEIEPKQKGGAKI